MQFSPPLQRATLIQRYKRFLADVITPDGTELTLHCPNTGAMTGCATPGDTVWYSTSENTKRKYPHTWELTQTRYIEVKSVTLAEQEYGYFPDAVTLRGQKHLRELMSVAAEGHRAVVLFAVLHSAITRFSPARHIDAKYAQLLIEAQLKGVEILVYKAELSAEGMTLKEPLPMTL